MTKFVRLTVSQNSAPIYATVRRAAVGVLAALLGVDRALQGAAALFIAQGIEIAVGGQAVADGIQNGGLAHRVDTDHIGQTGTIEGDIFKVVPVDKFQAL